MAIEIGILIAIIGCGIGVAGFLSGRHAAAKKDGQMLGEMQTDIRHIKEKLDVFSNSLSTALEREVTERKDADRRLHARVDELISRYCAGQPVK